MNRHFWERFGAAILISVINGAVQAGVQSASPSSGTVIYAPAGSQDVLTEVLKDTMHIPPTVVKANGDRIQVLVARDLDFRPVYALRAAVAGAVKRAARAAHRRRAVGARSHAARAAPAAGRTRT